jgi:hypothetical protein
MAKKKAAAGDGPVASVVNLRVSSENSPAQEVDEDEFEDLDRIEDGGLSRAIEELRSSEGVHAEVHRVSGGTSQGFCRKYPIAVFSQERIAQDYGAGKYRVRLKGPGDKYIKGGGTFEVAEAVHAPAAPANNMQDLLALLREQREQDRNAKKTDYLEWARVLVPLLGPKILDTMFGQKGPTLTELVTALKATKDLTDVPPQKGITEQFEQVFALIQGAKELVGEEKSGSTWVDLVRDALGAAKPVLGKLAGALPIPGMLPSGPQPLLTATTAPMAVPSQPVPAARPASAPTSGSAPEQGSPSPAGATDMGMLQTLQWLKSAAADLAFHANRQANPRLYGELMIDNLPPFITLQQLKEQLEKPDWWQNFVMLEKAVEPYQEWFTRCRNYMLRVATARLNKAADQQNDQRNAELEQRARDENPGDENE